MRCTRPSLVPTRMELDNTLSVVKDLTVETLKMPCTIKLDKYENEIVNIMQGWINKNKIANTVHFWNLRNISAVKIRTVMVVTPDILYK